jgi:hypothetical protein
MQSTVAVPLIHQSKPIGALNILDGPATAITERDAAILRMFASHVSARSSTRNCSSSSVHDAGAFELLAEIGVSGAVLISKSCWPASRS